MPKFISAVCPKPVPQPVIEYTYTVSFTDTERQRVMRMLAPLTGDEYYWLFKFFKRVNAGTSEGRSDYTEGL